MTIREPSAAHRAWGKQLAIWRMAIQLSQAGLANQLVKRHGEAYKVRSVGYWEKGEKIPDQDTIAQLLALFLKHQVVSLGPDGETETHPLWSDPAEPLDWLALLGYGLEEVKGLPLAGPVRKWVSTERIKPLAWNPPALPAAYVERAELARLAAQLTGLSDYRRPVVRALALHGPSGSGKTTLATALLQQPLVRGYFRHGGQFLPEQTARQLAAAGPAGEGFERWWAWLEAETTVGLVVIDDLTDGRLLGTLLGRAGPQVRFLVTTQERDQIVVGSGAVAAEQVCYEAVGGLSAAEAETLVSRLWQRELSEGERQEVARLRRQVSRPAALRLLAAEAAETGWELVGQWLWAQLDEQTPLADYWAALWERAWGRRSEAERQWLAELAGAVTGESSFGAVYAGLVWQATEPETAGRLALLARRGWLEEVAEPELALLAATTAVWAGPRYRFLREGWSFIRRERPARPGGWQQVELTWRLYRQVGAGLGLGPAELARRTKRRWLASDEVEELWRQLRQRDELGAWLRLTWSQHWLRPPAEIMRLVRAGQRGSVVFGGLSWGWAWLVVGGGLWLALARLGLAGWLATQGGPAWLEQTAPAWGLFLLGLGGSLAATIGQTLSYEVPLTLARTIVAAREEGEGEVDG